jgi:hypothetical protein
MIMKRLLAFIFFAVLPVIAISCGYKEGSRQLDNQSFLTFTGNIDGAFAVVDGGEPFPIDPVTYKDSQGNEVKRAEKTYYQVRPGRHIVVVNRDGQVKVEREVLINAGSTKEIWVP